MASISTNRKTGTRRILFTGLEGKRQAIRFGKISKRQAKTAKLHIEDLLTSLIAGTAPKPATAQWLQELPETIRARLESVGLAGQRNRRQCPTLADWMETYIKRRSDVKSSTATVYGHTQRNLLEYFGRSKRLDEITPGDADGFRVFLKMQEGLAKNTVARRIGIAKQFFRAAIRDKLLMENPFEGQSTLVRENSSRFYFVSREEAQAVLDACPNAEWRLIFALCRFGGLRCPSEVLRLQWGDVDWDKMRLTIHASKTAHHADAGIRHIPLFPEIHPYLQDCFEQAETGAVFAITRYRSPRVNLRTQLTKIIQRAGLTPWPKLFQNLRSTRETELAEEYPQHVACRWIGNTQSVAVKHYLQVTDEHFTKAAQKAAHFPAQCPTATPCLDSQDKPAGEHKTPRLQDYAELRKPLQTQGMGPRGLEPRTNGL